MDNAILKNSTGLYFPEADFYLDPVKKAAKAVISHAHADHAIASNTEVWCTPETMAIMRARYGDKLKSIFHPIPYQKEFRIGPAVIRFVPAGHILGSAQVVIDLNEIRYCYTGDFKVRPDESCAPFELVACDVLITETTFANPDVDHPEEVVEMDKLQQHNNFNVVIGAYSVGKAQRLNRLINNFLPQSSVMVHPETAVYHRVYEQQGVTPGKWEPYNYRKFVKEKGNILIVPPRVLSTYRYTPGIVTTFATGWSDHPIRSHFRFHLSDHADWKEIIWLVDQSKAKTILTVHGDGAPLKKHLNELKPEIKVKSLNRT